MHSGSYSVSFIAIITHARGRVVNDYQVNELVTDSRRITHAKQSLFFALKGRRDGHDFISEAYAAGIRSFIVELLPEVMPEDANFLLVEDVLNALQQLAAYYRGGFQLPIIGITGSNGKTIVKEWLYQLLAADEHIVRNPKSYNSQIGVPLSVWQIGKEDTLGIFEAGISTIDEMEALEPIIRPTIGVLTHIGAAHNEGFRSLSEKITEKLKLFAHSNLVVYQFETLLNYQEYLPQRRHFTWSYLYQEADLYVTGQQLQGSQTHIEAVFNQEKITCLIPFHDEASVENAITCWAVLLAMGYHPAEIKKRLSLLSAVSMRLELKNGRNNCSVIDDSYNSDLQSLEIALNFLNQQNQHPVRTLILSDIYQSGLQAETLYRQVADMVKQKGVDRFIGVGEQLVAHQNYFQCPEAHFYTQTNDLLQALPDLHFQNETILIKGARLFGFEEVSQALGQKVHGTVMEINLNALINNLNYYRSQLQPGVKLMAMVKAFSYGSGTFEVANVLQYNKADYLAVAYVDEGVALRQTGITLPIMVLNPEPSAFQQLIAYHLEPEIYSLSQLQELLSHLQSGGSPYPVHIKIDTGMHRLGFAPEELGQLCQILQQNTSIKVQSVFSHLVASDAAEHDDFTLQQFAQFEKACLQLQTVVMYPFLKHILNTSGISRWPQAQYNMVRLGIGLYGVDAAVPASSGKLQPVATLKTSIAQIKDIRAEETIGYNRKGVLHKDGRTATVRIGYADGYLRAFGNGVGQMLVNGKLAPTVGNIAMDMCMIDVSDIEVNEGDTAILFNEQHPIEELARQIGTIPYEILTNVSQRVKRVYFYE
ncbi:bifunctional UDP-N-acetylmuramoyl-tripeptide:D-alanyl-D-alanine ligase/alanine racemase [Mucilaginibacter koreensis]